MLHDSASFPSKKGGDFSKVLSRRTLAVAANKEEDASSECFGEKVGAFPTFFAFGES
jgi:hypothetical protein